MYNHRHRARSSVQRSAGSVGGVGKRTLTGDLEALEPLEPLEPVQMEGESPRAAAQVHSAAARGTASPTTAMPHGDRIQALFGPRHDLSQVHAHVGGSTAAQMRAVAGQSAADLLGPGGAPGAGNAAVQRKPEKLTAEQPVEDKKPKK